ncbi:MAG: hypothetical protein WDM76_04870 [Limisphaerales bacterium]
MADSRSSTRIRQRIPYWVYRADHYYRYFRQRFGNVSTLVVALQQWFRVVVGVAVAFSSGVAFLAAGFPVMAGVLAVVAREDHGDYETQEKFTKTTAS